jgi:hypothetical protein
MDVFGTLMRPGIEIAAPALITYHSAKLGSVVRASRKNERQGREKTESTSRNVPCSERPYR